MRKQYSRICIKHNILQKVNIVDQNSHGNKCIGPKYQENNR